MLFNTNKKIYAFLFTLRCVIAMKLNVDLIVKIITFVPLCLHTIIIRKKNTIGINNVKYT